MISPEEIRRHIPQYLAPESRAELFEGIAAFPDNITSRMYSSPPGVETTLLQGDGIRDLLMINLPDKRVAPAPAMILSNTCDIDPTNLQFSPRSICYAPIFNLEKYRQQLSARKIKSAEAIKQHVRDIRGYLVTGVFYLPTGGGLEDESIVFLDRICNCQTQSLDRGQLPERRIFTLSDYGAWLFLVVISIHFCRMNDRLDRRIGLEKRES